MVQIAHSLLIVLGYIFIVAFSLFYLRMGIALAMLAKELKLMAAPERPELTDRFLQPEWDDLTPEEQAAAKRHLPIVIFGYILIWLSYLAVAYIAVRFFFPGVLAFFSNI
jgi:hypothetical protein